MAAKPELLIVAAIPPELRKRLSANYTLVDERPAVGERRPDVPVIVTTSVAGADRVLMESLPDLQLIACNGTGLENIDLDAARNRGIRVQHTPDVVTEDTADFAIGLVYATTRRIAEADRFVRAGRWQSERMTPSRRVFTRTLGIVGLGKIGQAVARRASAIGMRVLYTGPREKLESGYAYCSSVVALARQADILVLCCPGGSHTQGLVDQEVLAALGPDGILVNVSRGSVVKEEDLIHALQQDTIAAAGLDVFSAEPQVDSRFFAMENTVLAPHYAAVTRETREAMADVLETAIDGFFGRPTVSATMRKSE